MTETPPAPASASSIRRPSKAPVIFGWVITILLSVLLLFSAVMKLVQPGDPEEMKKGLDHIGWPLEYIFRLGILELICVLIYLFPRTAVVGAILLTGYMGGAIATHVRVGDGVVIQVLIGILLWVALFLREPRLRALIPLRR